MSFQNNLLGGAKNWITDKGADLISGVKNNGNANKQRTGGMQRFISEMHANNGFYRANFFEVYIYGITGVEKSLNILCHNAALPGFRLETKDNVIYQLPYETPVGVTFDPAWFTFYIDNNFTVNNALYNATFNNTNAALGRINPDSWSPKYRDEHTLLKVEVVAFSIDMPGAQETQPSANTSGAKTWDGLNILAKYTLHNCFFKAVQQTPVDWGTHNSVSSVTTELSYEWFDAQYPQANNKFNPNSVAPPKGPLSNFDTLVSKFPALGVAYDAAKRTTLQNPAIQNNPLFNQGTNFLP